MVAAEGVVAAGERTHSQPRTHRQRPASHAVCAGQSIPKQGRAGQARLTRDRDVAAILGGPGVVKLRGWGGWIGRHGSGHADAVMHARGGGQQVAAAAACSSCTGRPPQLPVPSLPTPALQARATAPGRGRSAPAGSRRQRTLGCRPRCRPWPRPAWGGGGGELRACWEGTGDQAPASAGRGLWRLRPPAALPRPPLMCASSAVQCAPHLGGVEEVGEGVALRLGVLRHRFRAVLEGGGWKVDASAGFGRATPGA